MNDARNEPAAASDFDTLALPHFRELHTTALRLERHPEDARDLCQETLLRALRFFHQFEPGTDCRAWLMSILHNTFRNRIRARRVRGQTSDVEEAPTAWQVWCARGEANDPESIVLDRLHRKTVRDAIERLPASFRRAMRLVHVHELSYEEAAARLGCPVGTVRSRLFRGRAILRRELPDTFPAEPMRARTPLIPQESRPAA